MLDTQISINNYSIQSKSSKNLCLFAHFDKHNIIDEYVLRYLQSIKDNDFDIILISTAKLDPVEIGKCTDICRGVIVRNNLGLDFASWAEGYKRFGSDYHDGYLLLSNDSVYGPIGDLGPIIQHLRLKRVPLAGLVESIQSGRHLQSWFLLLSPEGHHSDAFKQIISQNFSKMEKKEIIAKGEIQLTDAMRSFGLEIASIFTIDKATNSMIGNFNPMHSAWFQIINDFKIPFLKVELLRDNPLGIYNISEWRNIVSKESPDLALMIEKHLIRTSANLNQNKLKKPAFFSSQAFLEREIGFRRQGSNLKRKMNELAYVFLAQVAKLAFALRRKISKFKFRH
ncbi:hypothetical protein KIH24_07995 [Rhizobiales bacterium TNE-4]|nr:hypothetical protein [Rhizobiales bacterium TNE-4]MBV1827565.1 hypothetical protein [Rhizobiales bacterium TNE-4]